MPSSASRRCSNGQSARAAGGKVAVASLLLFTHFPVGLSAQRSAYEELQTFSGVLRHIQINYVDSVTYADLVPAAIRGMLRVLDPHSYFASRADWERLSALERGQLAVTGVSLESVEGIATVVAVARSSPAAKAGVLPGDRIIRVSDTAVAGLEVKIVALRLAGSKGSKVQVQFERGSRVEPETFTLEIKRAFLEPRSVSTARMIDSVTGYVRLEEFGSTASKEVRDALRRMKGQGLQRAILDLRSNPGGMVIAAVEIASEFFPAQTVVFQTRGRKRDVDTTFRTKRDGDFASLALIVLIDERSASASEALAGSLQDHDRALIVGRRSFGKALMQSPSFLPSGDVVWLTVAHVFTPNGRFIQRRYRGLAVEQYLTLAGKTGAAEDTTTVFHTDSGREVRGGHGITPDVVLPLAAQLPVWWSHAADSAFDDAVADSVASTLPATAGARLDWLNATATWRATLLAPFLARLRARLGVAAPTDSALEARLSRILAARVAEVRWGPDAREEFVTRNDPAIRAAHAYFPRVAELLRGPAR